MTKVSEINSGVDRLYRSKFPMDHPIHLGLMAVCFVGTGCSIFMGLNILKNAYGWSKFNRCRDGGLLFSAGVCFISSAKEIYKDRRDFIQIQNWMRQNRQQEA